MALGHRVLQGQRLIFREMEVAGMAVPKHCRETHRVWREHVYTLYLTREHARANLAMAEALEGP